MTPEFNKPNFQGELVVSVSFSQLCGCLDLNICLLQNLGTRDAGTP
jgi:hypothetical protein